MGAPPSDRDTIGLFAEILAGGDDLLLRVTGGSMAPTVRSGDSVLLRRADGLRLRPGDLVLTRSPADTPKLHRIIRRGRAADGGRWFQTMGDALCTPEAPIGGSAVLALAIAVHRPLPDGGQRIIGLRTPLARLRGRVIALLARAGVRRLRRAGGGITPPPAR